MKANLLLIFLMLIVSIVSSQQIWADDSIQASAGTTYVDKVGEEADDLPSPDATYLDIKQVTLEKVKSNRIEVTIELVSDLPRRPEMTINHYMIMDLDVDKTTGKVSTADKNLAYDLYVGTAIYKGKGATNTWWGTYGKVFKDYKLKIGKMDVDGNKITFDMTSKWFKQDLPFKFRIYNWVTTFDEDNEDDTSSRTPIDSTGTRRFPKK